MMPRKVGDTVYPIRAQLSAAGAPFNLTGYGVTFSMRSEATGVKVSAAACTVVDAPNGIVSYQPSASDVDTAGDFLCEFRVTSGGGGVLHFPTGFETLTLLESIT